jgi:peptidoglycan/LPS O-acetylase OafA/YrhL
MKEYNIKIDFNILDSIRGIASLYVCIAHCRGILWVGINKYLETYSYDTWSAWDNFFAGLNVFTRLSTEFVIVFFVLSGFSIAHSIEKSTSIKTYYFRRFVRIYPPYILAIIWGGVVLLIINYFRPDFMMGNYDSLTYQRLVASRNYFEYNVLLKDLIFLPHLNGIINPLWSLSQEAIFYLLAPLLLLKRNFYFIVSILLFVAGMINSQFELFAERGVVLDFIFNYNIYFALGIILHTYFDEFLSYAVKIHKNTYFILILLIFLILIFLSVHATFPLLETTSLLVAALMSYLFIFLFLIYKVNNRFLRFIGSFSYTLYATHVPTIYLYLTLTYYILNIKEPYIFSHLFYFPAILFCIIIAYLFYLLVEKNTKKIIKKYREQNR